MCWLNSVTATHPAPSDRTEHHLFAQGHHVIGEGVGAARVAAGGQRPLIPLDLAIQAHSRDVLVPFGRGTAAEIIPLLGRFRRKDWVTAQFSTGQQAQTYAEGHALAPLDRQHRTARIELLHELLAQFPRGELLDAGCGPGVLVRSLLDSPAYNYRITMLDQSEAMIQYCIDHTGAAPAKCARW